MNAQDSSDNVVPFQRGRSETHETNALPVSANAEHFHHRSDRASGLLTILSIVSLMLWGPLRLLRPLIRSWSWMVRIIGPVSLLLIAFEWPNPENKTLALIAMFLYTAFSYWAYSGIDRLLFVLRPQFKNGRNLNKNSGKPRI